MNSKNGVPIQHGRGLEDVKRRIVEAFERMRQLAPPAQPQVVPPLVPETVEVGVIYTETQRVKFHKRVAELSACALSLPLVSGPVRNGVYEIFIPSESLEELYRAAGGCE